MVNNALLILLILSDLLWMFIPNNLVNSLINFIFRAVLGSKTAKLSRKYIVPVSILPSPPTSLSHFRRPHPSDLMMSECLEVPWVWVGLGRSAPSAPRFFSVPSCCAQALPILHLFHTCSHKWEESQDFSFPGLLHSSSYPTEPRGNSWVPEILSMASKGLCPQITKANRSVILLRNEWTTTCAKGPPTRPLLSHPPPPRHLGSFLPPPIPRDSCSMNSYMPCSI